MQVFSESWRGGPQHPRCGRIFQMAWKQQLDLVLIQMRKPLKFACRAIEFVWLYARNGFANSNYTMQTIQY